MLQLLSVAKFSLFLSTSYLICQQKYVLFILQAGSTCVAFFYSTQLTLQWQLLIMAILCPMAAVAFINAEFTTRQELRGVTLNVKQ